MSESPIQISLQRRVGCEMSLQSLSHSRRGGRYLISQLSRCDNLKPQISFLIQSSYTVPGSQPIKTAIQAEFSAAMKSLRRDFSSNPQAANVTSKVFVRSTKSGKVQKIVRELYLRQDIPCSSKLCSLCPSIAPADANGNSMRHFLDARQCPLLTQDSCAFRPLRSSRRHGGLPPRPLSSP